MQELDWQEPGSSSRRRRLLAPLLISVFILFTGLLLGGTIGWISGINTIRSIAEATASKGELVCGTGFPAIVIGSTAFGMTVGILPGLVVVIVLYLKNRERRKSNWAVYYGE